MKPAPAKELRTQADVASWLACGLALRRVTTEDDEQLVAQAIAACANELPALPPPGMIADVAVLLGGARLPLSTPLQSNDDSLKSAIRSYDDDVLARLVTNARFDDVLAAYAHLQPGDRATAIALVVGAICERASFQGASVSPAALRRALARPKEEREQAARAEITTAGSAATARLADAYDRLSRSARQARSLVDQHEVFALDHLNVLRDLGSRMTADHIAAAAEAIERTLPRRLPANRLNRGVRDTQLADESLYPAGGFTAITPGGSNANIENLVTSELVYMEDGPEPDIFTLRFVEGELLYYTRDDSVFRRHRQVIGIALGADLDDARVKDRDLPWQRLILALGMLVASIRWLTEQLGDHALTIRLAFPPNLLPEEKNIVALLLGGEIQRGTVVLEETPWQELVDQTAAANNTAITDVIVLSLGPTPTIPKGLRALHVDLRNAAPTAAAVGTPAPEPSADSWREWCEVAEDLLRWLV